MNRHSARIRPGVKNITLRLIANPSLSIRVQTQVLKHLQISFHRLPHRSSIVAHHQSAGARHKD